MHSVTVGFAILTLFCIFKFSFCDEDQKAETESKVVVRRNVVSEHTPIQKVRKIHRKKIPKGKRKKAKKKSRKIKRVKQVNNKKKRRRKQAKNKKKKRRNNLNVRERFRDRNEVYQNLWKQVKKSDKCVCGPIADSTRNRIVNGEEATPHEFPWIVSMIFPDGYWFCGGTILTEDYVVTASHCVDGMKPNAALIRIGDHDNDDPNDTDYHEKQTIKIKKIIMHSKYDPNTVNNDIALLKLGTKIDFKKFGGTVAPICLPETLRAYTGEKVSKT